jgi:hypothetical protein
LGVRESLGIPLRIIWLDPQGKHVEDADEHFEEKFLHPSLNSRYLGMTWVYSMPYSSTSDYNVRAIKFDKNGQVLRVIEDVYRD